MKTDEIVMIIDKTFTRFDKMWSIKMTRIGVFGKIWLVFEKLSMVFDKI